MEAIRNTLLIQPSDASLGTDDEIRARVYRAIAAHVRDVTGGTVPRSPSPSLGREILDAVTEIVVRTAIREGYFRLPGGFGSFRVQKLASSQKRLPSGELMDLSHRHRARLRYEDGAAVRELLGMPYKTSYRRKRLRRSKLSKRATEIGFSAKPLTPREQVAVGKTA